MKQKFVFFVDFDPPGSGEIFRALVLNLFWSSVGRLEQLGAVVVTQLTV